MLKMGKSTVKDSSQGLSQEVSQLQLAFYTQTLKHCGHSHYCRRSRMKIVLFLLKYLCMIAAGCLLTYGTIVIAISENAK